MLFEIIQVGITKLLQRFFGRGDLCPFIQFVWDSHFHAYFSYPDSNSCENLIAKNHNSFGCFSGDDKKFSDVPVLGTNNLTYSNIILIAGSVDEKIGIPNKPSAGDDIKTYDSEFLNPCTNKVKCLVTS